MLEIQYMILVELGARAIRVVEVQEKRLGITRDLPNGIRDLN
jgi:hypothetical protein